MLHGGDIYSDTIEYDFSVNLNPLDLSDVASRIMEQSTSKLLHYPDPAQRAFREAVSKIEGVAWEEVFGGNGASELFMALSAMLKPRKVLLLAPCFLGYRHALSTHPECEIKEYCLSRENGFAVGEDFLEALSREAREGLDLLILTNPNNPTGKNIPKEVLDSIFEICKAHSVKLLVDECFIRMSHGGYSMVPKIRAYSGLFVVNAFTKLFSVPGVRVGYVISDRTNIDNLKKYLPEWNLSVIAQTAGVVCSSYLEDVGFEEKTKEVLLKEGQYLTDELKSLGCTVFASDTCFLLFYSEEEIYAHLKEQKILIRDCANYQVLGKGFYRTAIKDHASNERLIRALKSRK